MRNQKGFTPIILLVVVLVILVIVGGVALVLTGKAKNPIQSSQPQVSESAKPSFPETANFPQIKISPPPQATGSADTSNWKTFTSKEYKYSLKYPAEVTLEEKNVSLDSQQIYNKTALYLRSQGGELRIYGICGVDYSPVKEKEATIAGQLSKKIYQTDTRGDYSAIPRPNSTEFLCFSFTLPANTNDRDKVDSLFDKVLTTLMFN